MHYTEEQIERARRTDLVGFMKSRGERLVRSGKEYRWKEHDSVTIYQDKWYRHSQGRGGDPIDFVMEFYGMSFPEAVQLLTGEEGVGPAERAGAPAPSPFRLPMRADTDTKAVEYLTKERGICPEIVEYFIRIGDIYQERESGCVVFVGRDPEGHPRYAHTRSITGRIRKDVTGAEKRYNFGYRGGNHSLFVFEAPIDMLSYISLYPENWKNSQYEKYNRDPDTKRRYGRCWKRIRDSYVKTHPFCEICYENGVLVPVEEVHHKKPLSEGGTHDRDNLISLCKSCHSRIHAQGGHFDPKG